VSGGRDSGELRYTVCKPPEKEASMSITDIIPAVRTLSRSEKFQLAQLLLEDLAREERSPVFKEGQVYPIYTPECAPDAASQLAQVLKEEGLRS
jgi:hypothetical protein